MARLPNVRAKEIIKALQRAGFEVQRQKGSHTSLRHPRSGLTTTVPLHPSEFPRWLLKHIIKDAGLTEDEFRELW
jgi:predicted RNA binding protein YcfA (HicA-like mRNA interferase family)